MTDTKLLVAQLASLFRYIGGRGDILNIAQDVIRRWQEPHRFYHNIDHLDECLTEHRRATAPGDYHVCLCPAAVELALFYHDVVYKIRQNTEDNTPVHDNEEQSVRILLEDCKVLHMSSELPLYVSQLILATEHKSIPTSPDAQLIVDIDLARFGAPPEAYTKYSQQLHDEYTQIYSERVYRAGRKQFLEDFLKGRASVFTSEYFRQRCEQQAQDNIHEEIRRLSE